MLMLMGKKFVTEYKSYFFKYYEKVIVVFSGNSNFIKTVLKTDTGGLVENTKAHKISVLKELGKLAL